jgi:hypothetical protein
MRNESVSSDPHFRQQQLRHASPGGAFLNCSFWLADAHARPSPEPAATLIEPDTARAAGMEPLRSPAWLRARFHGRGSAPINRS